MRKTFTLPDGRRITTQTRSRYALIVAHPDQDKPWISRRSSYKSVLEDVIGRHRRAGTPSSFWIGDTETGELTGYPPGQDMSKYPMPGEDDGTRTFTEDDQGNWHEVQPPMITLPATRFTVDAAALAELAELCPVYDDQDAVGVLTTAILGSDGDQAHAIIRGGCEIAADLLADHAEHGQVDGWRIIIHPSGELSDPWIASHIFRVSDLDRIPPSAVEPYDDREGSYDTAQIIREAVRTANELLEWNER